MFTRIQIIAAISAFFLMVFGFLYYQYTSTLKENVSLKMKQIQLEQNVKDIAASKKFILELQQYQQNVLIENRKTLEEKNMKLQELSDALDKRSDANDSASPYFKELFKGLQTK